MVVFWFKLCFMNVFNNSFNLKKKKKTTHVISRDILRFKKAKKNQLRDGESNPDQACDKRLF